MASTSRRRSLVPLSRVINDRIDHWRSSLAPAGHAVAGAPEARPTRSVEMLPAANGCTACHQGPASFRSDRISDRVHA
jgi:hypothetical protein